MAELVRGTGSGGGRSCRARRRTVLKPEYLYMQNVIKWYRKAIQCMHAYRRPSWYGELGAGGEELQGKKEDSLEA